MRADELLRGYPDGSIDVLITDPPYDSVDRRPDAGHLRDWFGGAMSWPQIGGVLRLARRKLAPDGVAFVMTNGAGLRDAITAVERAGFTHVRVITWDRGRPGLGGGLRHQTEHVLVGLLPGSRPLTGVDLISAPAVGSRTKDHYPTEKPEALGHALAAIAGIRRGDVVVDPFCGSGALLVGAKERWATVAGSDIAARAVKRASARLTARQKPVPAPARKPPRPSLEGRRPAGRRPIETRHATRRGAGKDRQHG